MAFITISNPRARAITRVFLFYPNTLQTSNIYTLYWVCKRLATLILVIISKHRKQVSPTHPSLTLDWRSCLRLCFLLLIPVLMYVWTFENWGVEQYFEWITHQEGNQSRREVYGYMVDYWLAHVSNLCDMQDCIPMYSWFKFLMSLSIWLVWIQIVSRQLANIWIVFIFIFGGIMVDLIHGYRNLGLGSRNSGITTNEDSYNVWLKTLGFPPSVLGGMIFKVTSAVPEETAWSLQYQGQVFGPTPGGIIPR